MSQTTDLEPASAKRDRFLTLAGSLIMGIVKCNAGFFFPTEVSSRHPRLRSRKRANLSRKALTSLMLEPISTRPGHEPVPEGLERARLEPVLRDLVDAIDQPVSIDTSKASVARWAAEQGVAFINDVWGLQKDPAMADVVAEAGAGVVHHAYRTEIDPDCDVIADMRRFFDHSLQQLAAKAGIPNRILFLIRASDSPKPEAKILKAAALACAPCKIMAYRCWSDCRVNPCSARLPGRLRLEI